MAEAGTPESTMLAIMGHMSRAMLERYSHIRMAAKRAGGKIAFSESGDENESTRGGPRRRRKCKWGPHKSPHSRRIRSWLTSR